jgi:hypothetical protein
LFSIKKELSNLFRGLHSNVSIAAGMQNDPVTQNSSKESQRYAYALAMLIKVAQSDGGISVAESIVINNVMDGFIKQKGLGFKLYQREQNAVVQAVKASPLDASYYARGLGVTATSNISGILRIALKVACAEPMNKQKEAAVASIAKCLVAPKGTYTLLLKEYNKPAHELLTLSKVTVGILSMLVGGRKSMQSAETKYLTDMVSGYALLDATHGKWVDESFDEASYIRVVINARNSLHVLSAYIVRLAYFSDHLSVQSKTSILLKMKDMAELGGINRGKLEIIGNVAQALKIPVHQVEELFANKSRKERLLVKSIESRLSQYYTILGCKPKDSLMTIKQKYRRLVKEFHPDTLSGQGLSEACINSANDRTIQIIDAYDKIKRSHS